MQNPAAQGGDDRRRGVYAGLGFLVKNVLFLLVSVCVRFCKYSKVGGVYCSFLILRQHYKVM